VGTGAPFFPVARLARFWRHAHANLLSRAGMLAKQCQFAILRKPALGCARCQSIDFIWRNVVSLKITIASQAQTARGR
jgi:hypothetical protein